MSPTALQTAEEYPLVSIAMCTYNGAPYLQQQIDSLFLQNYPNIEIIAVDDASNDNTKQILEENAARDSRFRFYFNKTNVGYNRNFENAIQLCSGQYIAISDQDDIWEADKITEMMSLWPTGSSFIYSLSGTFLNDEFKNRTPPPHVVYTDIDDVHKLVFNSPVHGHACMFKKELAVLSMPFPADKIYYDWWLSMYAAANGFVGYVPKILSWHRIHEKNSSKTILSIKDRNLRNEQLRQQSVQAIETFCNRNVLKQQDKDSLLQYVSILKAMDGEKFSWPMFRYIFTNRKKVFHYKKKKPFIIFSHIKRAIRMGYSGVL
jgi:glycosyltransferase involved in cell wall biosynthesis